jgi:hypothetical protein
MAGIGVVEPRSDRDDKHHHGKPVRFDDLPPNYMIILVREIHLLIAFIAQPPFKLPFDRERGRRWTFSQIKPLTSAFALAQAKS